ARPPAPGHPRLQRGDRHGQHRHRRLPRDRDRLLRGCGPRAGGPVARRAGRPPRVLPGRAAVPLEPGAALLGGGPPAVGAARPGAAAVVDARPGRHERGGARRARRAAAGVTRAGGVHRGTGPHATLCGGRARDRPAAGQPGREVRRSGRRSPRGAPVIDAGATGLVHEAAIYGDDDELLDVVVPFVAAGARAGEAVVVVLDRRGAARVRAATVEDPRIAYLPQEDTYARPAATLRALRSHVDRRLAGGAGRVRMVGAFPPPAVAASWDAWCRYEAAVDRVFADDPVSLLCAYDARVATGDVLADAEQLHHRIALPGGTRV